MGEKFWKFREEFSKSRERKENFRENIHPYLFQHPLSEHKGLEDSNKVTRTKPSAGTRSPSCALLLLVMTTAWLLSGINALLPKIELNWWAHQTSHISVNPGSYQFRVISNCRYDFNRLICFLRIDWIKGILVICGLEIWGFHKFYCRICIISNLCQILSKKNTFFCT